MTTANHHRKAGEAYWRYIESTYNSAAIYDGPEVFLKSIVGEPRSAVLVYAAHFAQSEIYNGGLLQFFWNTTGVLAPEAVEGFGLIGMPQVSELLRNLVHRIGMPYPRNRDDRWDALLMESGRDTKALETVFASDQNLYLKFQEATTLLFPKALNEKAWELLRNENGGFSEAADSYVTGLKFG